MRCHACAGMVYSMVVAVRRRLHAGFSWRVCLMSMLHCRHQGYPCLARKAAVKRMQNREGIGTQEVQNTHATRSRQPRALMRQEGGCRVRCSGGVRQRHAVRSPVMIAPGPARGMVACGAVRKRREYMFCQVSAGARKSTACDVHVPSPCMRPCSSTVVCCWRQSKRRLRRRQSQAPG